MDELLKLSAVSKSFGPVRVLEHLDLSVARGEFVSLLGPSGCGKTTLLRLIAGLLSVDDGSIHVDGHDLTRLPPHKRNIGVVFQNYALFPHLTVANNIAFGLKARRRPPLEIQEEVRRVLSLVQLSEYGPRPVSALSGGQQQRVAVARALAVKPRLLLLDEPFSALDRKLRDSMRIELRHILRELGITAIFVTHDQEEALVMSDRIAVMNRGVIEQFDRSKAIYDRPQTPFVLEFVGHSTRIHGLIVGRDGATAVVDTAYGRLRAPTTHAAGTRVMLALRPERLSVGQTEHPSRNCMALRLHDAAFVGAKFQLLFSATGADSILAEVNPGTVELPAEGQEMHFSWLIADTLVYAGAS